MSSFSRPCVRSSKIFFRNRVYALWAYDAHEPGYFASQNTPGFLLCGAEMKSYSPDELQEAKRQIDSTIKKLQKVLETFRNKENSGRYRSQITLVQRRLKAFEIANSFIEEAIERGEYVSRESGRPYSERTDGDR